MEVVYRFRFRHMKKPAIDHIPNHDRAFLLGGIDPASNKLQAVYDIA